MLRHLHGKMVVHLVVRHASPERSAHLVATGVLYRALNSRAMPISPRKRNRENLLLSLRAERRKNRLLKRAALGDSSALAERGSC
jgi:hypothetical protein